MKLIAINKAHSTSDLKRLDAMYRLRHRVFTQRMAWQVNDRGGLEKDRFDDLCPTYILAVASKERIAGSARLLPAIGPTMLECTFPQLLRNGKLQASPDMVESSRFCVDTSMTEGRGYIHETTLAMFAGIVEWCLLHGYKEIATATDVRFERILHRAGWPMTRLGEPVPINETTGIAGLLPVSPEVFEHLRPKSYRSDFQLHQCSAA